MWRGLRRTQRIKWRRMVARSHTPAAWGERYRLWGVCS